MAPVLKFDEERLRRATTERARGLYEKRWTALNSAVLQTLDVSAWRKAWNEARGVEKEAHRALARVRRALTDAALFPELCTSGGRPMGAAALLLADCAPLLLRTLDRLDDKAATRVVVNPAEEPTRAAWLRNRVRVIYYGTSAALKAAPREELAVLGILGGWWPPKATGRAVSNANGGGGMTAANAIALEADLMDRARRRVLYQTGM